MYNIQMQLAALCILALLIYCVHAKKRLHSFSDNVYLMLIYTNLFNVCISIFSTHVAYKLDYLQKDIIHFIMKLYLCSYIWIGVLVFLIVLDEIVRDRQKMHRIMHLTCIPAYFGICYCLLLELQYSMANGRVIIAGVSRQVAFVVTMGYLLLTVFMVFMIRKESRHRTNGIAVLLIVVLVGLMTNWVLDLHWQMDGLCYIMISVYLYLNITNADNHIDYSLGIFNQKAFEYYLKDLIEEEKDVRVLYISFDDFKGISSTFGAGSERVLFKNVVQALQKITEGKLFRIDTYQLAYIFVGNEEDYHDFSYAVKYKLRDDYDISNVKIKLVSYVVEIPVQELDLDYESLRTALQFYVPEMIDRGYHELMLTENHLYKKQEADRIQTAVAKAIENQDVEVYYQPIWNVNENRYDGAEALLRLRDDDGNEIPAALAVAIAEEAGQAVELGHLVFRKVFSYMSEEGILGKYLNRIHINLSCAQSANTKIVRDLTALMAEFKIAPSYVDLELKEQEQHLEDMLLKDNMHSLLDYGNTFSLDDYGKGYANLSSIMFLPFQYVKLDKSLVHLEHPNEKAEVALHFVLDMARQLGIKVVAKGVETAEDMERMKKMAVNYMQGFYIAEPLCAEDFLNLLKNHCEQINSRV